ncbi:MAG TPA: transcriptional regulator [Candidatus Nanoarchaeia archaeon]|nr:transcriptional regulator [Candidatus Nanoarchaeia archaeon]
MVNKIVLPQELETFYVIPALRRQLALAMDEAGMKQKDIASHLGINTSAISQYKSKKRGEKIELNPEIVQHIKQSATKVKDQLSYVRETQRLLHLIRTSGALCQIHKQLSTIPDHCEPQLVQCHLTARGCY